MSFHRSLVSRLRPIAALAFAASFGSLAPLGTSSVPTALAADQPPTTTVTLGSDLPVDGVASAQQLLDLVNGLRAEHGVAPLEISLVAADVAFERSLDMLACNLCSFDHDIPGVGYAPNWEITQIHGALGAGENLGVTIQPNDQFVQWLFDSWVASPTHYENLLRPQWTHVGLGIVEVQLRPGLSEKVVTQLFVMAGGPLSRA
jgi:uncharacterized protein YkwD